MSLACCWHCVPLCFPRTCVHKCAPQLRRSSTPSQVTTFLTPPEEDPDVLKQEVIFFGLLWRPTSSPGPHPWEPQHPIRGHKMKLLNPESAISKMQASRTTTLTTPHEAPHGNAQKGWLETSHSLTTVLLPSALSRISSEQQRRREPQFPSTPDKMHRTIENQQKKHCGSTFASSRGHTVLS